MRQAMAATLAVLALVLGLGSSANAADALTEDSTREAKVKNGVDYLDRWQQKCAFEKQSPAVQIKCRRGGWAGLLFEFQVPAKAINMRVKVDRDEIFTGRKYNFGVDGIWRTSARSVQFVVGAGGRMNIKIHAVTLLFDLPTKYDRRACVTPGEWARINVWKGGHGGNMRRIANVFDTHGRRTYISESEGGFRYQVRKYNKCNSQGRYALTFHHNAGTPGWWSYWG